MRDMFFNMNQRNMIELQKKHLDGKGKSKIEVSDFILLRRLGDFMLSSETVAVVKEGGIFHWVNYDTVQEGLPVVFPSKVSLKKRVEKLKKIGLIVNKTHNVKKEDTSDFGFKNAGTYSVIQLSKDVRKLFDEPIKVEEDAEGLHHEGVKGSNHEGVKGSNHEGVKGWHHNGVNKETQEKNTLISIYLSKVAEITNLSKLVIENKFRGEEIQHFNLEKVMEEIEKSDFLLGKVPTARGRYVSAEHFLREEYVAKIISRQYRNKIKKAFGSNKKQNEKAAAKNALEEYKKGVGLAEEIEEPEIIEAEIVEEAYPWE